MIKYRYKNYNIMKISKNYTNENYEKLNLAFWNNKNWDKAIKILKERIEERFFNPLDLLINSEKKELPINKTYWFAILSISCLLMETIQWFKDWIYNHNWKSSSLIKKFCKNIWLEENDIKFFYKNIRCWILHKWEIEKCLVRSTSSKVEDNIFTKNYKNEKILQRTVLYLKIKKEFYNYLKDLSNSEYLKKNYIEVMNNICEINKKD